MIFRRFEPVIAPRGARPKSDPEDHDAGAPAVPWHRLAGLDHQLNNGNMSAFVTETDIRLECITILQNSRF